MGDRKKGLLLVLAGAACWATLPVFSRYIYSLGGNPVTAAAMRAYLSGAFFLVWFLITGRFKQLKLKEIPFYVLYGVIGVSLTYLCYMSAVNMIPTAMAAILLYTGPAFVILFSRILYGVPITSEKVIALVCTLVGCALTVGLYNPESLAVNLPGILVGLASGLAYSMITIFGQKAEQYHDSTTNTGYMSITGTFLFFFIVPPWSVSIPDTRMWLGFAAVALVGSVGGYLTYLKGVSLLKDGGLAGITATAEPVLCILLCALIFGDKIEWPQIIGIVIVIAGICIPNLEQIHKARIKKYTED